MQTYAILEGNMERVMKKINRIQNKCKKYGCEFHFAEVGEEYRELTNENGETYTARFVLVEAEGKAEINGWKFIASVEHTEKGNIINRSCDIEVPERYYNSLPVCEHCNTKRMRKDTYIVMNEETGEFKQVGRSCLADYTNGMSAEGVAMFASGFDEIISGEAPYPDGNYSRYIKTEEFLKYVAETIRHFGYVKNDWENRSIRSTSDRASEYYGVNHGWFSSWWSERYLEDLRKEMKSCGFNPESAEATEETGKALEWIAEQAETNNYMHNLKVVCANKYLDARNMGILASLFPTYNRNLEREYLRKKEAEQAKASEYVGKVGDRVTVNVKSVKLVTSWETIYGMTFIWKITGEDGNIYIWKTGNSIEDNCKSIKGTVKDHKEYRGVKQTELTRCKCAA